MFSEDLVIEALVDSNFDPNKHEAYAFCTDMFEKTTPGRLRDAVFSSLGKVDWDRVTEELKKINGDFYMKVKVSK